VKKANKNFKTFRVIIILSSLYSSDIILGNTELYYVSNKPNGIKIGLKLYSLWQIHGYQLN